LPRSASIDHHSPKIRNQQVGGSSPLAGSKTLKKSAILSVAHKDLFISRSTVQVSASAPRTKHGIVKTLAVCSDVAMSQPSTRPTLYKGYRFPPEIISHCVWLYYRFGVSLRDVSELMLARGIEVAHEAISLWTLRFGTEYARRLRRTRGACSNIWHLDELCLMIQWGAGLAAM
jgi:hypothetical protein